MRLFLYCRVVSQSVQFLLKIMKIRSTNLLEHLVSLIEASASHEPDDPEVDKLNSVPEKSSKMAEKGDENVEM
jgi:hypothetical protein